MDPTDLINRLGLRPHPEGGWFRETYRSSLVIPAAVAGRQAERHCSTAIYYLLTASDVSNFHRLGSDEVFHFYCGDPVTMVHLGQAGCETITLGSDVAGGHRPQVIIPAGTWQAAHLAELGHFALMGCTVAPGFDFADFEMAERQDLIEQFPQHADLIETLTAD
ncbi:MAG: cupin domain-containing protein [Planctomycetota bacterium]|jgi:predicted cupin superfamily sugar epimerase